MMPYLKFSFVKSPNRDMGAVYQLVKSIDWKLRSHNIKPIDWLLTDEGDKIVYEAAIPGDCAPEFDEVSEELADLLSQLGRTHVVEDYDYDKDKQEES